MVVGLSLQNFALNNIRGNRKRIRFSTEHSIARFRWIEKLLCKLENNSCQFSIQKYLLNYASKRFLIRAFNVLEAVTIKLSMTAFSTNKNILIPWIYWRFNFLKDFTLRKQNAPCNIHFLFELSSFLKLLQNNQVVTDSFTSEASLIPWTNGHFNYLWEGLLRLATILQYAKIIQEYFQLVPDPSFTRVVVWK